MTQNNQHNEIPKDTVEALQDDFDRKFLMDMSWIHRKDFPLLIQFWIKEALTAAYNKGIEVGRAAEKERILNISWIECGTDATNLLEEALSLNEEVSL